MKMLFVALALTTLAAEARAESVKIGAAAAVQGAVQAVAPGAVGRVLQSGQPLFLNDHVTTDSKGRLQVMLLDETIFTLGPNSDMVLDEFVYDPASSAGKVTARVTKGVFRFVTGKVARRDPASMKVKLPVGTIGIRGTIAGGEVTEKESTVVLLGPGVDNNAGEPPGVVVVENNGLEVFLEKPGFGTSFKEGDPPAPPSDMSEKAAELALDLEPGGASDSDGTIPEIDDGSSQASEDSGQETAAAGDAASEVVESDVLSEDLDGEATVSAQETADESGIIVAGLATWDDVRTLQTGTGYWTGSGDWFCDGGEMCAGGVTGTLDYTLTVDFGARTIGGGDSSITLNDPISDAAIISATSFDSLQGDAILELDGANSNNSNFNGTSFQLLNEDNAPADTVSATLKYDNGSETGTGTVVSDPRIEGSPPNLEF